MSGSGQVLSERGGDGPLGARLRARRARANLSLQDLADRVGCAKSLLSEIERGMRLPTDDICGRLEEALMFRAGELLDLARWERSLQAGGEPVRRELDRLQSDRRALRRFVEAIADKGLDAAYTSGELARLVAQIAPPAAPGSPDDPDDEVPEFDPDVSIVRLGADVPLINKVAAGYPREFTDLSYPARVADEYVRCPDLHDPDAFAARVVGDSMMPQYAQGDVVIFSPAKPVRNGSDCFARIEPNHETTFKRVYFEKDASGRELIRLQPLNSAYPPRLLEREAVAGLYAAVSVMRTIP
ncbi:MAG: LexA family transcriptional regulator [Planctomycetota bacterium]|nr:LexA family transcriptional regulator [Planctomycetota bacterium]